MLTAQSPSYEYQVGGSLPLDAPSYVRRQADEQLYQALLNSEFCYVLNSRQMGKSSLRVQTMYRLQSVGIRCGTIDITAIGTQQVTPEQWYASIVGSLANSFQLKVNVRTWWRDRNHLSNVNRLSEFLETVLLVELEQNVVIFIDEIDSVLGLKFPIDDFFALIRAVHNKRAEKSIYKRLTFALLGVATPSDLIADKNRTPFNIGRAIELRGFELDEAIPLLPGLTGILSNPQAILEQILYWSGGQPFLTQKLCQGVLSACREQAEDVLRIACGNEASWVEKLVKKRIIDNWEAQDEPEHLKTIRDRLLRNSQRAARLLGIYQQILSFPPQERQKEREEEEGEIFPIQNPGRYLSCAAIPAQPRAPKSKIQNYQGGVPTDDSPEQMELLLSGLVEKQQGFLKVKNPIYQNVFDLEWVEEQLASLRPYTQAFDAWIASKQQDASRLLRGQALKDASYWAQGKSLSDLDYQFLAASQELDRLEVQQTLEAARLREVEARLAEEHKRLVLERETAKRQRRFIGALSAVLMVAIASSTLALWQYHHAVTSEQQARISEVQALTSSSTGQFASQQRLDALVTAIKARRRLDSFPNSSLQLQSQVQQVLQQAIYGTAQINRLSGHKGWVLAVDATPDGQLIATGSNDRTVKLWQLDGTLVQTLPHTATVHALSFSPDSQRLVTSSLDGNIYLWNRQGKLLKTFAGHSGAIWDIAVSPEGDRIASAGEDSTIRLWNLNGKPLKTLSGHQGGVWGVAFSPDGKLLASGSIDSTVKLWNLDGKLVRTLEGHRAGVLDVEFALLADKDGTKHPAIVSASADNTVKIWQPDGGAGTGGLPLQTFSGHSSEVFEVAVSTAGDVIASASADATIRLWKPDGTLLKVLKGHESGIRGVSFIPNSQLVVSASDDNTARLWNPKNPFSKVLYGHGGTVWDVNFSPDGTMLASASSDRSVRVWAIDGTLLKSFAGNRAAIRSVAFLGGASFAKSANAPALATSSEDKTIKIWQLDGTLLKTITGHRAGVLHISASPDGRLLASASDDRTIKLWEADARRREAPLRTFTGHRIRVLDVDFTPDGQRLVSASGDGTVRLWSLDGRFSKTLEGHRSAIWGVTISRDGSTLASASMDDRIKLWTSEGALLKTIEGNTRGLMGVDFSPDGEMLVGGGATGAVKLWKTDGTEITNLTGHEGNVWAVKFSPDGKSIASAGDDRTVILWDVERILKLDELAYACDRVRDYLRTNAEVKEEDRHLCDRVKTQKAGE